MLKKRSKIAIALIQTLILVPLLLSLLTGIVKAPPLPIGDPGYIQANPFDSNPTAGVYSNVGTMTGTFPDNAKDGDLDTNVNWVYGAGDPATPPSFVEVSAFKKPSDNGLTDFTIQWIDIKVSYKAASITANDDKYRFVAYVDPSATEIVLADWVTSDAAKYDPGLGVQGHRTFSNVAEPNNGVWTWTDLANLRVRVDCLRVGTNGFQKVTLYEVWVTAYSTAYPSPSTASVQPSLVAGLHAGDLFYIDIYATDVTNMWGYGVLVNFDPAILTPLEYFSYGPFVTALPSEIGTNYVAVAYKTFDGDPTGFTGNTPMTRIYFTVGADGTSILNMTKLEVADVYGALIVLTPVHGLFSTIAPTTGTISGTVKDASTNNPISGATVEATGPQTKQATTGADGKYTIADLAPGDYSVKASKTGYQDSTKPATVLVGLTTTVDFSLTVVPTTGTISGTVTDASTNDPIQGAILEATGPDTKQASTGADGKYTILDLTPGDYSVTASATNYQDSTKSATVTAGEITTLDFSLTPAAPTKGAISGTVTDASTNDPISGASIDAEGPEIRSATTDADGKYTIADLTPGDYSVTASATGYQDSTKSATVEAGETTTLDFSLATVPAAFGYIEGHVTDADTLSPIEGATVTADGHSNTTDATGYYTIKVPAPATYDVTAEMTGYISQTKTDVSVAADQIVTADFALTLVPPPGTLNGTVTDASTTLPIEGATVTANGQSDITDATGYYEIELAAGTYDVTASKTGYQPGTATGVVIVSGQTTTQDFALTLVPPPGTLEGTVTDASTTLPIAGATITANGESTTTDATGHYLIELDPGTYDVTAEKTGYITQTATGVVIVSGQTTVQDFALLLKPIPVGAEVNSTDSLGNLKAKFVPTDEVFAKGKGFAANQDVTIYIIPDGKDLLPGNAVTSGAAATTGADGSLPTTLVWSPPLTPGNYDIWVDANKNGVFDTGDALNNVKIGEYGFFVIPEPVILVSVLLMFGALAMFYLRRKRITAR